MIESTQCVNFQRPTLYFGQKYYNGRNDKPWICKLRAKNREKKKREIV